VIERAACGVWRGARAGVGMVYYFTQVRKNAY
jgi:hypothetical protein